MALRIWTVGFKRNALLAVAPTRILSMPVSRTLMERKNLQPFFTKPSVVFSRTALAHHWGETLGNSCSGTTSYPSGSGATSAGGAASAEAMDQDENTWTCNHCTFINRGDLQSCEICSLPR